MCQSPEGYQPTSCLTFNQPHHFQRLQLNQLAVDSVAGMEDFGCLGLCVHAVADARSGTGIEQADVLGVQVFGEEEFID